MDPSAFLAKTRPTLPLIGRLHWLGQSDLGMRSQTAFSHGKNIRLSQSRGGVGWKAANKVPKEHKSVRIFAMLVFINGLRSVRDVSDHNLSIIIFIPQDFCRGEPGRF